MGKAGLRARLFGSMKSKFRILSSAFLVLLFSAFFVHAGSLVNNVYTDKARYSPGDSATITVGLLNGTGGAFTGSVAVAVSHLGNILTNFPGQSIANLAASVSSNVVFVWTPPSTNDFQGYLVWVTAEDSSNNLIDSSSSAIDVSSDWSKFPRYGYVTRYTAGLNASNVMWQLENYHLNGIQFYDWQWEHHIPYNPGTNWPDIADRTNYQSTVSNLIAAAHSYNMVAMNYNLYGGAYADYATDGSGVQLSMGIFSGSKPGSGYTISNQLNYTLPPGWATPALYEMNNSDTNWQNYIYGREQAVFTNFNFDGWHIDSLGQHTAYNSSGNYFSLDDANPAFINNAVTVLGKRMLFNTVDAGGENQVAQSANVDFVYSELWANNADYSAFEQRVNNVRSFGSKAEVLAAYMNTGLNTGNFNEASVRLCDAGIFACGADHLELGDGSEMLHDATGYFPDDSNVTMSASLTAAMRTYYDFMVGYENLLRGDTVGATNQVTVAGVATSTDGNAGTVWVISKSTLGYNIVHFVNLLNNPSAIWRDVNATYPVPSTLANLVVKMYYRGPLGGGRLWYASPDSNHGSPTQLSYTSGADSGGSYVDFTLPQLQYWDMIWLEIDGTNSAADTFLAANYDSMAGISNEPTSDVGGGYDVGWVENTAGDSYVAFNNVDFGSSGFTDVFARVAAAVADGTIEFHLDTPTGPVIATVPVGNTGGWQSWQTETAPVSGASGLHNLFVVFKNAASNLHWFQFNPPFTPAAPTNLSASLDGANQIDLAWSSSSGATYYLVELNGSPIATTFATSYSVDGLALSTLYCYTVVAVDNGLASTGSAPVCAMTPAPNSWTNAAGGKWEMAVNWSLGAPNISQPGLMITNANTKTVTIDAVTTNTPGAMTINTLTVSAPPGTTNTLFLNHAGAATPLQLLNGLTLDTNGALAVNNSALTATNGLAQFIVGNTGGNAALTITNGGALNTAGPAYVGGNLGNGSSTNTVMLAGNNSVWNCSQGGNFDVGLGWNSVDNSIIITNGARLTTTGTCNIGAYNGSSSGSSNAVSIAGPGSTWLGTGLIRIGDGSIGQGNQLRIGGGGSFTSGGAIIGNNGGAPVPSVSGNLVVVTDPGSSWTIQGVLSLGDGSVGSWGNSLTVSNGGLVSCSVGEIGNSNGGSNNTVLVTGSNSIWSISNDLYVGNAGGANRLIITNGGSVVASNAFVGFLASSPGNTISIVGGSLMVTNGQGAGTLVVGASGQGNLTFNGGTATVNQLLLTNGANSMFAFNAGTLASGGTSVTNNQLFAVGDGTDAATFQLNGGVHSFANNLEIRSNAFLTGCGMINGNVVVDAGGTVLADCGGRLTFTGSITNNGTMRASNSSVLESYGPVVNNGLIDITGGTTNFHSTFINNGSVLSGPAPVFQITGAEKQGNSILVTWTAFGGTTNILQATGGSTQGGYSTNFVNISPLIYIAGSALSATNYLDAGGATNTTPSRYYRVGLATSLAFDNAANYTSSGWGTIATNANLGVGFGPWIFSGTNLAADAGCFLGTSTSADSTTNIDVNGTSFANYNINGGSGELDVIRPFAGGALAPGQSVQITWQTRLINPGYPAGFSLLDNATAWTNANDRAIEYYFVGGRTNYTMNNGSSVDLGPGDAYTLDGQIVTFMLVTSNTVDLTVQNVKTGALFSTNGIALNPHSGPIVAIRFFDDNGANDPTHDIFFNSLGVINP